MPSRPLRRRAPAPTAAFRRCFPRTPRRPGCRRFRCRCRRRARGSARRACAGCRHDARKSEQFRAWRKPTMAAVRRSGIRRFPRWLARRAGLYRTPADLTGPWLPLNRSSRPLPAKRTARVGSPSRQAYRSVPRCMASGRSGTEDDPVESMAFCGNVRRRAKLHGSQPGERRHRLVDALPSGELRAVERCLELFSECGDSFVQALLNAPEAAGRSSDEDHGALEEGGRALEARRLCFRPRVTRRTWDMTRALNGTRPALRDMKKLDPEARGADSGGRGGPG